MEDLIYWVWLAHTARVPTDLGTELIESFGSAEKIYNAKDWEIKNALGIPLNDERIIKSWNTKEAERIVEKCQSMGIKIIPYNHPDYPKRLKTTIKPPCVIYVRGEIMDWENMLAIGVVGTRMCTEYGIKTTHEICTELTKRGITIVSGMAKGIDTVAAESALNSGGKTIAVIGCGANVVYPRENAGLMKRICQNGTVISEYPPDTKPLPYHFPARNRIISGLSRGVLVIEAPKKSGALITVDYAQSTNRDIFSVPGSIFSKNSLGTNNLIKNGAKIVCSPEDIFEYYKEDLEKIKPIKEKKKENKGEDKILLSHEKFASLSEDEKVAVGQLLLGEKSIDELVLITGKDVKFFNIILPILEIKGIVKKLSTDKYTLKV